tara:strand:- start:48 stop:737 length:690 start_codon:yes stop_codon:yes gene_type:complete
MKKSESFISKTYADYERYKRFAMVTIASLSVAVVLLMFMAFNKEPIVVMVPPNMTKDMVIEGDKASEEYQTQFAYQTALLVGNISKRNIDFVVDRMEEMLSPALRQVVSEKLKSEARVLQVRELEQTFSVDDVMYSDTRNIVWVWGKRSVKGKGVPPISDDYTYEFQFIVNNGMPRLTHYKAYSGHPTTTVIKSQGTEVVNEYYTEEQMKLKEGITAKPLNAKGENDED